MVKVDSVTVKIFGPASLRRRRETYTGGDLKPIDLRSKRESQNPVLRKTHDSSANFHSEKERRHF